MDAGTRIAKLIDHTLLSPTATRSDVRRLCSEAVAHGFATVCVNGVWVPEAARLLSGENVRVCGVVGFPLGASASRAMLAETAAALDDGASEMDMVLGLGLMLGGEDALAADDVNAVAALVHERGAILKVILETGLLDDADTIRAARIAVAAGADYVKTSTGFLGGGATVADVRLLRETVGPVVGVKASGGIRSLEQARELVRAGASRLGTSRGVDIVAGETAEASDY